ncbi:hypothetical protein FRC00_013590, partial [Tulasnella sp. 408]
MSASTVLIRRPDEEKSTAAQAVHYARLGTTAAKAATSVGFFTLEAGTHITFSLARTVTTSTVTSVTRKVEDAIIGRDIYTRVPLNFMLRKYFDVAESLSLIPITVGQKVTRTSINVGSSCIELGAKVFNVPPENADGYGGHMSLSFDSPEGASQAAEGPLFGDGSVNFASSIPALIRILEREWHSPRISADHLPNNDETYSGIQILYALVAWSGIQKVTRVHHQRKWLANMKEIEDWEWRGLPNPKEVTPVPTPGVRSRADTIGRQQARSRRNTLRDRNRPPSVHVVSDYHLPDHSGEILTAEIGAPTLSPYPWSSHRISQASFSRYSQFSFEGSSVIEDKPEKVPYHIIRHSLRRFSRMVMGGYGGAGVLLFGVKLPSVAKSGKITASFNEAGDGFTVKYSAPEEPKPSGTRRRIQSIEDVESARTTATNATEEVAGQSSFSVDVKIPRLPRALAELVGTSSAADRRTPLSSSPSPQPVSNSIPFPTASSSASGSAPKPEWDERSILEDVMENAGDSDSDDDEASAWEMLE